MKNVLHDIYNRLPKEQSLDNILNVRHGSPAYDDQCDDPDAEETSEGDTVGMGTSPEHNMVHDEVKKIRITAANMSILKTGKTLDCQPGDILEYRPGPDYEEEGE